MLIEQRQHFKTNERVLSLYQKKVAAQRLLINELKFMISITPIDDPERNLQIQNLKAMNEVLKIAVADLIGVEEEIVAKDLAASTKNKVAFLVPFPTNHTIASPLDCVDSKLLGG